jgi:hypothetical protein
MEELLNQHKDNSTIQMVYFPYELSREKALLRGIYQCLFYRNRKLVLSTPRRS